MGIYEIAVINKGIAYQCNFFVVPGNAPALLGMPNYEWLQLLSVNCETTNNQQKE